MILEIEYYNHDTRLIGKTEDISELKRQLMETETLYDKQTDNFTQLFCRMFCNGNLVSSWILAHRFSTKTSQLSSHLTLTLRQIS